MHSVLVMVNTCCILGCKTGYRSAKNETKIATFSFPANEEQKKKWIAAILCKDSKVCAKYFIDSDIENQSKDYHEKRCEDRASQSLKRLKLKPNAIPRISLNLLLLVEANKIYFFNKMQRRCLLKIALTALKC